MACYSAIDYIYNLFLITFALKSYVSKYVAHKKSEFRGYFISMFKFCKDVPFCDLDNSAFWRGYVSDYKKTLVTFVTL